MVCLSFFYELDWLSCLPLTFTLRAMHANFDRSARSCKCCIGHKQPKKSNLGFAGLSRYSCIVWQTTVFLRLPSFLKTPPVKQLLCSIDKLLEHYFNFKLLSEFLMISVFLMISHGISILIIIDDIKEKSWQLLLALLSYILYLVWEDTLSLDTCAADCTLGLDCFCWERCVFHLSRKD